MYTSFDDTCEWAASLLLRVFSVLYYIAVLSSHSLSHYYCFYVPFSVDIDMGLVQELAEIFYALSNVFISTLLELAIPQCPSGRTFHRISWTSYCHRHWMILCLLHYPRPRYCRYSVRVLHFIAVQLCDSIPLTGWVMMIHSFVGDSAKMPLSSKWDDSQTVYRNAVVIQATNACEISF